MNDYKFGWYCFECGAGNYDSFFHTRSPRCGNCGTSYIWDDILSTSEMQRACRYYKEYTVRTLWGVE